MRRSDAAPAAGMPTVGNIAFVSQSGALAVALMDKARKEHLAFSKIISVGNKMQISESISGTITSKDSIYCAGALLFDLNPIYLLYLIFIVFWIGVLRQIKL